MKRPKNNHGWRYKNLTFVLIGFLGAILLSRFEAFHSFLLHLGNLGYVGPFLAGMLFVSTFTVATGGLILLVLAETLSPTEIGLIAGLGAVVGDLTIFHLVKDNLGSWIRIDTQSLAGMTSPMLMPVLGTESQMVYPTNAQVTSSTQTMSTESVEMTPAEKKKLEALAAKIQKAFWSRNVIVARRLADAKDHTGQLTA
jgi:hypothetical protein